VNEHSRWMMSQLHVQGWSNCTNERQWLVPIHLNANNNVSFEFKIRFRSYYLLYSCAIIHGSVWNFDQSSRITAPAFSIDRPFAFGLTAYRMEQQIFHGKQNFSSETPGHRESDDSIRVMLFSCFRRIIVFLKYRSTSREWAWWDLARKCHVCVCLRACIHGCRWCQSPSSREGQRIDRRDAGSDRTDARNCWYRCDVGRRVGRERDCRMHVTGRFRGRIDIIVRISSLRSNISP